MDAKEISAESGCADMTTSPLALAKLWSRQSSLVMNKASVASVPSSRHGNSSNRRAHLSRQPTMDGIADPEGDIVHFCRLLCSSQKDGSSAISGRVVHEHDPTLTAAVLVYTYSRRPAAGGARGRQLDINPAAAAPQRRWCSSGAWRRSAGLPTWRQTVWQRRARLQSPGNCVQPPGGYGSWACFRTKTEGHLPAVTSSGCTSWHNPAHNCRGGVGQRCRHVSAEWAAAA